MTNDLYRRDSWSRQIYLPGDIVGVQRSGPIPWLSRNLIIPRCGLFHFLLIGHYIPQDDDYEIFESIRKGVAVGRLSWYANARYIVFRPIVPTADVKSEAAIDEASAFGRMPYDWKLFVQFFADWIRHSWKHLISEGKIPRMSPADFHFTKNKAFICTEFVVSTWAEVGVDLLDPGDAPVPSAFIKVLGRRLIKVDSHDGTKKNWRTRWGAQGAIPTQKYDHRGHWRAIRHGEHPAHVRGEHGR